MSALDINTNGSWRVVVRDLRPNREERVMAACVAITQAAGIASGKSGAPAWRLRGVEGRVFMRLDFRRTAEGCDDTVWREVP